jgi:hypothetical protein
VDCRRGSVTTSQPEKLVILSAEYSSRSEEYLESKDPYPLNFADYVWEFPLLALTNSLRESTTPYLSIFYR